ncbi:hypothetical protein Q5P01_008912 [Channa striata]|uniref:Uncharacterized protein n=1 Tax=Channa striata TaxID=64152 RepID=A0AA88SUH2_CHASR|nr:hypothetical protein Q5P01_008912 [Channa striata]
MSQSNTSKDSQALLQSMLQRLKLQPGREGQAFLHTPANTAVPSTWGQDGQREAFNFQEVNISPVNGCEFMNSASNSGPTGGEIQQQSHGCEPDSGPASLRSQKDGDTGVERVLAQATSPVTPPTEKGQLFPAQSLKDADVTSFERTNGERVNFGSSAMVMNIPGTHNAVRIMGQNQERNQGFTSKDYIWSLKPTDASLNAGIEENRMLHPENGGFGVSAQSKDLQFAANSQTTKNSGSIRKQRPSENRTRKWTQKIKERWRDRQERFGKKSKEQGISLDQKSEQVNEASPQKQQLPTENMNNTPNKEEERILLSPDSRYASKIPPAHTEDSSPEGQIRSSSDFEFGLGSFSLLEEIVTGQEWAKFLNPNISGPSVNQSLSKESLGQSQMPPNPYYSVQPSVFSNQQQGGSNHWKFWGTEATQGSHSGMAQISPGASLPVPYMDVHREGDQSEPMDDGLNQSHLQLEQRCPGQQRRPPSFVQPADFLDKSRAHPNRKRQHQSAERRDDNFQPEQEADRERSISTSSVASNHGMDETGESQRNNVMSLYTLDSSPAPLSPCSFNPFAAAPRGVLKHSISRDSECSMETLTKRRRVEENRRVRFSEEVMSIEPLEPDLNATESESEMDNDSVIEQDCEVEQAGVEEVAPARRHALPAWILALKRKNTGRKHR